MRFLRLSSIVFAVLIAMAAGGAALHPTYGKDDTSKPTTTPQKPTCHSIIVKCLDDCDQTSSCAPSKSSPQGVRAPKACQRCIDKCSSISTEGLDCTGPK